MKTWVKNFCTFACLALMILVMVGVVLELGNLWETRTYVEKKDISVLMPEVTFDDVAGIDDLVDDLQEIVSFLKKPQAFNSLGARLPKGFLFIGPPGVGKTMIARAVAGEVSCPFYPCSGSEFVEKYVGVGAKRVRDLFRKAKQSAPCIIFIDEVDAIGSTRRRHDDGGEEHVQTLNQLLSEMDGFESNDGIIVIAATNRPEMLDPALQRSGRFDRKIFFPLPNQKARYEILEVHAKHIKISPDVDLQNLAKKTTYASGADLENILNEGALIAARKGKRYVDGNDLDEAKDRVRFGHASSYQKLSDLEREVVAYHESGHTILSHLLENVQSAEKVSIIPRGGYLGVTCCEDEEEKSFFWKKELKDHLVVLMGGRCAEQIFFGDVTTGASDDIQKASAIAKQIVLRWGLGEQMSLSAYDQQENHFANQSYSEQTAQKIDHEIQRLLDDAYGKATNMLTKYKSHVAKIAETLLQQETMTGDELRVILKDITR